VFAILTLTLATGVNLSPPRVVFAKYHLVISGMRQFFFVFKLSALQWRHLAIFFACLYFHANAQQFTAFKLK